MQHAHLQRNNGNSLATKAGVLVSLMRQKPWLWFLPLLCGVLLITTAMRPAPTGLQAIFDRGELIVATRNDPVAFYQDHHGKTGFEYELAKRFANSLGVKLHVIKADNIDQMYQLLAKGKADIAAGALAIDPTRSNQISYSNQFLTTGREFIYRMGEKRPNTLADLKGRSVAVLTGSNNAAWLTNLNNYAAGIHLHKINAGNSSYLLALVSSGKVDYALVDDHAFTLQHPLFPGLATAFHVNGEQHFAWALPKHSASDFRHAVNTFLKNAQKQGTIQTLAAQFYGSHSAFNFYAARVFMQHLENRLPQYSKDFYQAGQHNHLDWRLLAAMGYQESHWNPSATSPTGVRGLMMLTLRTASVLGVNRENPAQSIAGGARYLRKLLNDLPDHIHQPDRTFMAIAAYNIGMGHLEDARILTQTQGGNPDSWHDVEKRLPLLAKPTYGNYLKHGMADGPQAVTYVKQVRHYYNLLVWAENSQPHKTMLAFIN